MLDFLCKESYDLRDFVALITFLRSPDGCPWDQVQTHESIRRNFLEETYEACEAIDAGDTAHLKEELGDVLMQVLFHTDIEREAGHFDIDDVADAACKKLVQRALTRFHLPYITVTPTFSICPTHGYLEGEHAFCPKCDAERLAAKRRAAAN